MHPAIRSLYKQFLLLTKDYPQGRTAAIKKLRHGFQQNSTLDVSDPVILQQALNRGDFVLKEIMALVRLHKYR